MSTPCRYRIRKAGPGTGMARYEECDKEADLVVDGKGYCHDHIPHGTIARKEEQARQVAVRKAQEVEKRKWRILGAKARRAGITADLAAKSFGFKEDWDE